MTQMKRASVTWENRSDKFKLENLGFNLQYFAFYNARYRHMNQWVKDTALRKWGDDIDMIKLCDLMDKRGQRVCVVGVLLKAMKLQPSILREVSEDLELIPEAPRHRYTQDTDSLSLQDETESVCLVGIDVSILVTGVMVAVIGVGTENGNKFIVEDFCYASTAPQKPLVLPKEDKYILFISDLGMAINPDPKAEAARNALVDFLSGALGPENNRKASKVVRVIIAGNCLSEESRDQEKELEVLEDDVEDEWNRKERAYTVETMEIMDDFLMSLGATVNVDVMPGPLDATSILMPQQPHHPCLLPKSCRLSSVTCVSNPYEATFDGILFVGTSGQVVKSIYELSTHDEPVDILDQTITWRHLAPTAPDSVPSYPFRDRDPFVMDEVPHVYFTGNSKSFNTKLRKKDDSTCRILSIPSFQSTQTCVLLNLKNLECEVVAFNL